MNPRPTASSVASILAVQLEIPLDRVVPTACLFVDLRALPLALVRASLALEEAFGIVLPDDALANVRTVEDFMALVARHSRSRSARVHFVSGRRLTRAPKRMRRGRWA